MYLRGNSQAGSNNADVSRLFWKAGILKHGLLNYPDCQLQNTVKFACPLNLYFGLVFEPEMGALGFYLGNMFSLNV